MTEQKIVFKKMKMWTEAEDSILKVHFEDIPFSSHNGGIRWGYFNSKLKEGLGENYIERTENAIARRCLRIGLKCFSMSNAMMEVVCENCGLSYQKAEKYVTRDKKNICTACQKIDGGYSSRERHLQYHREYNAKYCKKKVNWEDKKKCQEKVF